MSEAAHALVQTDVRAMQAQASQVTRCPPCVCAALPAGFIAVLGFTRPGASLDAPQQLQHHSRLLAFPCDGQPSDSVVWAGAWVNSTATPPCQVTASAGV
jgi:hypothetical protein